MPLYYNNHAYKTWGGLIKAIKSNNPSWSYNRVNRYAGGLRKRQEGKKHGRKSNHR